MTRRRRRTIGHTSNGRGTLLVERTFPPPLGKLRLASGTTDHQALADINKMLDAWVESVPPRWDLVEAVASKRVKPLHALTLWRQNRTEDIPRAEVVPPLREVYEGWLERLRCSDHHKACIKSTFKQLLELGSEPQLKDVPALLAQRREICAANGIAIAFNHNKRHVQALVRDTLGDDHPLYRAVRKVASLEAEETARRKALPPQDVAFYLNGLPEPHRWIAWSLYVTGMRPKEYFARPWHLQIDRVSLGKSKTAAGKRDIPLWAVGLPVLPQRSRDAFEDMWRRRIGPEWGIYNLRRSFAVLMEDAGIPRSRRKIYLGHAAEDVTGMYERRELDAWLRQDAERLDSLAGTVVRGALAALQPMGLVVVA